MVIDKVADFLKRNKIIMGMDRDAGIGAQAAAGLSGNTPGLWGAPVTVGLSSGADSVCRGTPVTVGLSGGADSVCLLHILYTLGCSVRAVHVNHMIRGGEAERDADFAADFCARYSIPFAVKKVNVPLYAENEGLTLEQAARLMRYKALREAAGGGLVAVAHNKNDQAETVLLRVTRGSGSGGLAAMQEVNGDIIRPLLDVSRDEIEDYCRCYGLDYVTDSTNLITDCSRNIIRLNVLPELQRINPSAIQGIKRAAELMRLDDDCLCMLARQQADRIITIEGNSAHVCAGELLKLHRAVSARVLRIAVAMVDSLVDIEYTHIEACIKLCGLQSGRRADLPRGITALRSGGELIIYRCAHQGVPGTYAKAEIPFAEGSMHLGETGITVSLTQSLNRHTDRCEYIMPGDTHGLVLRFRREGDYIRPIGASGSKSLKKFLIDKKVPVYKRDSLVLVARGSEILAVVGLAVSCSAAVDGEGVIYKIEVTG